MYEIRILNQKNEVVFTATGSAEALSYIPLGDIAEVNDHAILIDLATGEVLQEEDFKREEDLEGLRIEDDDWGRDCEDENLECGFNPYSGNYDFEN